MQLQQTIFKRVTPPKLFRTAASFHLALALTAFNFVIIGLLFVFAKVMGLPDPVTHMARAASMSDLVNSMVLAGLWSVGDIVLLLALLDANRDKAE